MSPRWFRRAASWLLLLTLLLLAQRLPVAQAAPPEVTLVATDYAFALPATLPAGLTRVTLRNEGKEPHHAQWMRPKEGKTIEEALAALQSGDIGALLAAVEAVGGPTIVAPGGSTSVLIPLEEGEYLVACFIADAEGVPHVASGMLAQVSVTASGVESEAPPSGVAVALSDFRIDMPTALTAGTTTFAVSNKGPQLHEMVILQLAEGKSVEDAVAFVEGTGEAGPPPFATIGGVQGLSVGIDNFTSVELAPGEYVATCFIPDAATGKAHALLGMATPFTVGAAPATLPQTGGDGVQRLLGWGALLLLAALAFRARRARQLA